MRAVSQTAPKTSRPHGDVVSERCGLVAVRRHGSVFGARLSACAGRFVGASRTRREPHDHSDGTEAARRPDGITSAVLSGHSSPESSLVAWNRDRVALLREHDRENLRRLRRARVARHRVHLAWRVERLEEHLSWRQNGWGLLVHGKAVLPL